MCRAENETSQIGFTSIRLALALVLVWMGVLAFRTHFSCLLSCWKDGSNVLEAICFKHLLLALASYSTIVR